MALDISKLFGKKAKPQADAADAGRPGIAVRRLPLIGHLPVTTQYQILGALFIAAGLASIIAANILYQSARLATSYSVAAGEVRVLAYQLPSAAIRASDGDVTAFADLRRGIQRISEVTNLLAQGGDYNDVQLPPSPAEPRAVLDGFMADWTLQQRSIERIVRQEKPIVRIGYLAEDIRRSDQQAAMASKLGANTRAALDTVVVGLNRLVFGEGYNELIVGQLRADVAAAQALSKSDTVLHGWLQDIAENLAALPDEGKELDLARRFSGQIMRSQRVVTQKADELVTAYQVGASGQDIAQMVVAVGGSLALIMLILIVKVFRDDNYARNAEAVRQQRLAEGSREATQAAILRLMNEMSDLADGDLTVRATVTEDITGAIADSVNYTVEELSVLVGRINRAAGQVEGATDTARQISGELLAASERQATEIREAGNQISSMSKSMTEVSHRAQESANVARVSLDVAHKGSAAVNESINGMNEIRGQIQETAKRIKRLGESSQEIGEIVELISDITEQTNVLALNAAIQAASAGEAGRGFSVVAEEVQRLAERSGEATKQIAALVKTIQTDTQEAVAAMESSTQNVVEGAKRSDAAGQALTEISDVTQRLAQLIEAIAASTSKQSEIAGTVAGSMQRILAITERTTQGTQQTAVSVGELAALAAELKGSVSGFKV